MSVPELCTALPGEADLAGYTIVAATAGHPLLGWLRGDTSEYRLRGDAAMLAQFAITHGVVDWCDDRTAIAVWLRQPPPDSGWPPLGLRDGFEPDLAYTRRVGHLLEGLPPVPADGGPLHLLCIAVEPGFRGTGRAGALLAHRHRHLDRDGTPAAAYAFDVPTYALLTCNGYQAQEKIATVGEQPCWSMSRPAPGAAVIAAAQV